MTGVFLVDLAYAAGVAISPTPIVVVIAMLYANAEGRYNALGFLIGWVIGLAILSFVLFYLVTAGTLFLDSSSALARPLVQIGLGLLIIALAVRRWNRPPKTDAVAATPKWMAKADEWLTRSTQHLTPGRAIVLAITMSAFSPKNIALLLATVFTISEAELDASQAALLLVVFVIISSIAVGIPVIYALIAGDDAQPKLEYWKEWVLKNRGRAIALLLAILGGIVLTNGVIGLLEMTTLG